MSTHPIDPAIIWPTKSRVPADVRQWQNDVVGAQAIAEAAKVLLDGEPVRFARLKRGDAGWSVLNIVRFAYDEADGEDPEGSGLPFRISDNDGDPIRDVGTHSLNFYERAAVHEHAELAVVMAEYLGLGGATYCRLKP